MVDLLKICVAQRKRKYNPRRISILIGENFEDGLKAGGYRALGDQYPFCAGFCSFFLPRTRSNGLGRLQLIRLCVHLRQNSGLIGCWPVAIARQVCATDADEDRE